MRWQLPMPQEAEGRLYLRVKLALATAPGARLLPFSTLIALPTPNRPTAVSGCPSLFAPCFVPAVRNCYCASGGAS